VDSVLNAPTQLARSEEGMVRSGPETQVSRVNSDQYIFDPMLADGEEFNDLNWLNTIDWAQGDWRDVSHELQYRLP
jgi:hypothetical protein